MEKKDFNIHDVGRVNLFNGYEEMNSMDLIVKEEMFSEISSDVNVCTHENDIDTKLMNSNETVLHPLQDNDQVSINDSETPFCSVGIKTQSTDDYENEASSANLESKNSSLVYQGYLERQCSVDDQYLEEKFSSKLSNMPCIKIKLEREEDVDSCESNDMSLPIDMNKKSDCSSVEHGCDMGHSSTEFIRGIDCQEYPMLRVMEEDSENTDMRNAPSHGIPSKPVELHDTCINDVTIKSSYAVNSSREMLKEVRVVLERASVKGGNAFLETETGNKVSDKGALAEEEHCEERNALMQRTRSNTLHHENLLMKKHNDKNFAPRDSVCFDPLDKGSLHEITTMMQTHSTKVGNYTCISSTKYFIKNIDLEKHTHTHKIASTRESLTEGSALVKQTERQYQCEICKKTFSGKSTIERHIRKHTGEKPFQCEICKKSFSEKRVLKEHIRSHSNDKPYQCEICNKTFTRSMSIKGHMRIHTGEKPYQCEICKETFREAGSVKKHMRTHTGEKPYQCNFCEKSFRAGKNLKKHIRTHTNERPYQCKICKKTYIERCNLRRHEQTHTRESPLQCEICAKTFFLSDALKKHMKIHTGVKSFQCDICQLSFLYKCYLKNHMRTHTKETPYQCEICKKKFSLLSAFEGHMSVHTGGKPFQCDICQISFRFKATLIRHMRTHTC